MSSIETSAASSFLLLRCLVDVPGEKLPADLPAYLRQTVAPEVPEELREAFLKALDKSQIRTMQNKQLYSAPLHQPGKSHREVLLCQQIFFMLKIKFTTK